jgi:phosphoglycerate dehydrogenase-like enzyme
MTIISSMSAKPLVLILAWTPDGGLARLAAECPDFEFLDARDPAVLGRHLGRASVAYGPPPVNRLGDATALRWVQLISAGVPGDLCRAAHARGLTLTNLAGLYGPTIAEHALALMTVLARNLHVALRNQARRRWDRGVAKTLWDLHGRTLAVVGLGNIGRGIARLARCYGMRVVGCRRTDQPVADVDRVYPCRELHEMLGEADVVAVAAPLTDRTEGMLGAAEFAAMRRGVLYVNVSRGPVAQEAALLDALRSGHVAAAGLDVYAAEPLPDDHPLWTMPNVVVSPHYSGETVNNSSLPLERFLRNLHNWRVSQPLEGRVSTEHGY